MGLQVGAVKQGTRLARGAGSASLSPEYSEDVALLIQRIDARRFRHPAADFVPKLSFAFEIRFDKFMPITGIKITGSAVHLAPNFPSYTPTLQARTSLHQSKQLVDASPMGKL